MSGKWCRRRIALKMLQRIPRVLGGRHFRALLEIPSCPGPFLGFVRATNLLRSVGGRRCFGRVTWRCVARQLRSLSCNPSRCLHSWVCTGVRWSGRKLHLFYEVVDKAVFSVSGRSRRGFLRKYLFHPSERLCSFLHFQSLGLPAFVSMVSDGGLHFFS